VTSVIPHLWCKIEVGLSATVLCSNLHAPGRSVHPFLHPHVCSTVRGSARCAVSFPKPRLLPTSLLVLLPHCTTVVEEPPHSQRSLHYCPFLHCSTSTLYRPPLGDFSPKRRAPNPAKTQPPQIVQLKPYQKQYRPILHSFVQMSQAFSLCPPEWRGERPHRDRGILSRVNYA